MKKIIIISVLGISVVLAGIYAWSFFSSGPRYPGRRVPASMIPPPVTVTLTGSNAAFRVFPGIGGAFLILSDDSLWQWGQVGPGTWGRAKIPTQVGTNCDWQKAITANNHALAIKKDGTLWEWGWRGGSTFTSQPQRVDAGHDWVDVAAGDVHSVVLKRDGTLWAWGDNTVGQLGTGPGPNRTNLVQVGTNNDWVAISCPQGRHTFAIRRDGTLWEWGEAYVFSPGFSRSTYWYPTQVCRESDWVGFEGGFQAQVRNRRGQVWMPNLKFPDAAASMETVGTLWSSNSTGKQAVVALGDSKMFEVRSDGTLWSTPLKFLMETRKMEPLNRWRRVDKRSDWISLQCSGGTAYGLTADGTVWIWGLDIGLDPEPDPRSQLADLWQKVLGWVGKAPRGRTTVSYFMHQETPRPLLRVVPPKTGHGGEKE